MCVLQKSIVKIHRFERLELSTIRVGARGLVAPTLYSRNTAGGEVDGTDTGCGRMDGERVGRGKASRSRKSRRDCESTPGPADRPTHHDGTVRVRRPSTNQPTNQPTTRPAAAAAVAVAAAAAAVA